MHRLHVLTPSAALPCGAEEFRAARRPKGGGVINVSSVAALCASAVQREL